METTSLPAGTVKFLVTDIEGSTRLWVRHRGGMDAALARHGALVDAIILEHGGTLVKRRREAGAAGGGSSEP